MCDDSEDRIQDRHYCHRGRASKFLLCAVYFAIGVGLAARLKQYIGTPSYWYDEAYLLVSISTKSYGELLGPLRGFQASPPLFSWALRALYELAGASEWAMRLPAFLASMATVVLIIPLARRTLSGSGWCWAAVFCALSRHAIVHSYEAKVYSVDVFATVVTFLSGAICLKGYSHRERTFGWGMVFVLASIAPWLSYPSVFVLGGVSASLFVDGFRHRSPNRLVAWFAMSSLLVLSFASVYIFAIRIQTSDYMTSYWQPFFPNLTSAVDSLRWFIETLVHIGTYGTTGMGWPLLGFAVLGFARLVQRDVATAVMLAGTLILAFAAAIFRLYPLHDRLAFFAVPCIWLGAAAGIDCLLSSVSARWRFVLLTVVLAIPANDLILALQYVAVVKPRVDFRSAFDFVHARRRSGDRLWLPFTEVYEVYHGIDSHLLPSHPSPDQIEQVVRSQRLWLIVAPNAPQTYPTIFSRLKRLAGTPHLHHTVRGLEIMLFQTRPEAKPGNRQNPP
ncbi:MAG: hypothetical protein KatS3mg105_0017 [Gemmatales bacterium]|nr:MAG: hypothetical protein KatS3mg105_0017 [Gemmatales bacterium]